MLPHRLPPRAQLGCQRQITVLYRESEGSKALEEGLHADHKILEHFEGSRCGEWLKLSDLLADGEVGGEGGKGTGDGSDEGLKGVGTVVHPFNQRKHVVVHRSQEPRAQCSLASAFKPREIGPPREPPKKHREVLPIEGGLWRKSNALRHVG